MIDSPARFAWIQQRIWSETANRLKNGLTHARRWMLGLLIAGAVLETCAAQLVLGGDVWPPLTTVAGICGAASLAAAAFLRYRRLATDRVRDWLRARSASEALKEAVYLDAANASEEPLMDTAQRILDKVKDLELHAALVEAPEREPPGKLTTEEYIHLRVEAQIEGYYRSRAREMAGRLALIRKVEMLALLAGVLLGASAPYTAAGMAAWVAVLTTIAGALVAETEAARYQYLVVSYRTTARRLEALCLAWRTRTANEAPPQPERVAFIRKCEEAISAENESWMAEWVKEG